MLRRVQVHVAYPIQQPPLPGIGFPGQPSNPVGFAATPAAQPPVWPGGTWPGAYPGSLLGPFSMPTLAGNFGGTIPSGTPGNPTIVSFTDIDGGSTASSISSTGLDSGPLVHDVTFVGCRFQGCTFAQDNVVECWKSGSSNIAFIYCSFTPRRTAGPNFSKVNSRAVLDVAVPGSWPSGSVGTGQQGGFNVPITGGGEGAYQTPYLSGAVVCITIGASAGTYMIIDHCDMWGAGYGVRGTAVFPLGPAQSSTTPHYITDNWMHDNRFGAPPTWDSTFSYLTNAFVWGSDFAIYQALSGTTNVDPTTDGGVHWHQLQNSGDHGEIIGFTQGSQPPPHNWLIKHNTLATLGNTGVFPWQSTLSNFVNIQMINNYLSGTQSVIDTGTQASGPANTDWLFRDNIFATDLQYFAATIDHVGAPQPMQAQFTQTNGNRNIWRNNKLQVYPGDNWSDFSGSGFPQPNARWNGYFVLPGTPSIGNNLSTTDWAL
jgi:hypothetical protein